jgi:hypothetical protein
LKGLTLRLAVGFSEQEALDDVKAKVVRLTQRPDAVKSMV